MKYVAGLVAIIVLAAAATADARPVTEEQKKAKRSALSKSDESRPSKSKNPRLQRRTERNVETDFRTGIGDNKGRRRSGIGDDDDDD
jgi:hypothetical protein